MLAKTIASYGGAYSDSEPVEDPTTQVSSANFNRALEDLSQLTSGPLKAWVLFPTVAAGASTVSKAKSIWGAGNSVWPTVTRTGVGTYTITYSASYTDELSVSETVALNAATGAVQSLTVKGSVQCSATSSNVITIQVFDSTFTAADLTVGTLIFVQIV